MAKKTLDELVAEGAVTLGSISIRHSRTRSNGNFGNNKYDCGVTIELSDDADYNEVLDAANDRLRAELNRQEAETNIVEEVEQWLHHRRSLEELQGKRAFVEAVPGLGKTERARLLALIDKKRDAEQRTLERTAALKAADAEEPFEPDDDPYDPPAHAALPLPRPAL
jgi:hypothetical protein